MNARISVRSCGASALACPSASSATPNWPTRSTPPTSGSSSAPASGSAISPARAKRPRRWGPARPRGRWRAPALTAADIDLIIVATSTPDYTFPADRDADPGGARHHPRRRVRPAGGLLRLRVRGDDGRQVPDLRLAQARAGDRRGDVFAPARLGGPHDLRAVRRRRRGDGAGGGGRRRRATRPA